MRLLVPVFCVLLVVPAYGQTADPLGPFAEEPTPYQILGISVEGAESDFTRGFVRQTSGLNEGDTVSIPGDPAFGDAIRNIYRLGMFSDIQIVQERVVGQGVYLAIRVQEEPKLSGYTITGVKKGHRKDLEKKLPLVPRNPIRTSAIETSVRIIKDFYAEKGRPLATVEVEQTDNGDNTVGVEFKVDKGAAVRVSAVNISGNENVSDGKIRGAMKTKKKGGLKFWRRGKFDEQKYEEDISRVLDLYGSKGYYDAQILRDTVFVETESGKPKMIVELDVKEGNKFYLRDIQWEGNSLYDDETLTQALGLESGGVFNSTRLEENLYGNKNSTDVASLHLNRGYMRFRVVPEVSVVGADSLDLHFEISEGDIYKFGRVDIAGNTKTKEHVVRRELLTVPGATFSREAIQESIRRLIQLNFFTQESLAAGPSIDVNDNDKTVDIGYSVEETGSDQLELSGTWGQFGLILQLRFTFNNFSAQNLFKGDEWKPIPAGDGQQLSVGVQTNGRQYQQYSLSYSEPWFRGKPRLTGFSVSYSTIGVNFSNSTAGSLTTASSRVFIDQQIKWPDDNFRLSSSLGYQYFNNKNWISTLRQGISHEITLRQTLARNSTNHPIFPSAGSRMVLSGEIAPPIGDLIQYHKWNIQSSWNLPLSNKVSFGVGTRFGFIGSVSGEPVEFERYVVGGSPFESSGSRGFYGKDIVYTRGYPLAAIGPRLNDDPVGGLILNKYTSELRWMAIQSPQLQAQPFAFMDAVNTWNGFSDYNPASLFRSAGFGARMFLPILGLVELTYGYNLDEFSPLAGQGSGDRRWKFQFTLGQGFGL